MSKIKLDFFVINPIIDKASYFLEYKYGIPFDLCQAKGIEAIVDNYDKYEEIIFSEDLSKEQKNNKLYYLVKDYIRKNSEVFQKIIETEEGERKKIWFSPYFNKLVYDGIEELGYVSSLADESIEDLKEIYYNKKQLLELNEKESLFIDLCFSGFNPYNHIDVLVFKEALETDSGNYVKNFFNRLCVKLEKKSLEIGLR